MQNSCIFNPLNSDDIKMKFQKYLAMTLNSDEKKTLNINVYDQNKTKKTLAGVTNNTCTRQTPSTFYHGQGKAHKALALAEEPVAGNGCLGTIFLQWNSHW